MFVDLHTHSEYSPDSQTPLEVMLQRAAEQKVGIYALTDHVELCHPWEEETLTYTLPQSHAAALRVRDTAPLQLLVGVELAQPLQAPEKARHVLGDYEFDFVIGSVHTPAGFRDFYDLDFRELPDEEIYASLKEYYRDYLQMAEWGQFDALAHITYPYRYLNAGKRLRHIPIDASQFDEDADRVLKAVAEQGLALELNLRSLTRSPEDIPLNARYFRRFREFGGRRVTIGSDAHAPEDITVGIEQGYALLWDAGFREITYYKERRPYTIPLEI